ncbi:MAG: enoyl-CoA hydratase-related protein, partial [Rhodocyclaceae bacterium]
MGEFETIRLAISDGVGELTLHRPEKLNAFNAAMHEELRAAFDAIEGAAQAPEPLRALILTGAGRAFCVGQDLSERRRGPG